MNIKETIGDAIAVACIFGGLYGLLVIGHGMGW